MKPTREGRLAMEIFEATLKAVRLLPVDFVGVAAWPFFAVILVYTFRAQFGDFLTRVTELSWNGAKATPSQQQNIGSEIVGKAIAENRSVSEAVKPSTPRDEVLESIEQYVQDELRKQNIDNLSPEQQREFYIREYATKLRSEHFALIGLQVFGTQIAALRHLDAGVPQSKDALMPIFQEYKKRVGNPGVSPDFYSWIRFLLDKKLIKTDVDGRYFITSAGRQFLWDFASVNNISETTRAF